MALDSSFGVVARRPHHSPVRRGLMLSRSTNRRVARHRRTVTTGARGRDLGRQPREDLVFAVAVESRAQQPARDSPEQYSK